MNFNSVYYLRNGTANKDDLAQIDRDYLQSLEKEAVIDVACELRDFSIALVEKIQP